MRRENQQEQHSNPNQSRRNFWSSAHFPILAKSERHRNECHPIWPKKFKVFVHEKTIGDSSTFQRWLCESNKTWWTRSSWWRRPRHIKRSVSDAPRPYFNPTFDNFKADISCHFCPIHRCEFKFIVKLTNIHKKVLFICFCIVQMEKKVWEFFPTSRFPQKRKPLMWERLKFTERFHFVNSTKVRFSPVLSFPSRRCNKLGHCVDKFDHNLFAAKLCKKCVSFPSKGIFFR